MAAESTGSSVLPAPFATAAIGAALVRSLRVHGDVQACLRRLHFVRGRCRTKLTICGLFATCCRSLPDV